LLTVKVNVVLCLRTPEVAETVRVYVPGGVDVVDPLPLPPHPLNPTSRQAIATRQNSDRELRLSLPVNGIRISPRAIANVPSAKGASLERSDAVAGRFTVSVTFTGPEFAGNDAGENVAVAPGGRPVIENVIGLAEGPPGRATASE
jgi:hypothetical protein